jgi:hypothetical protein
MINPPRDSPYKRINMLVVMFLSLSVSAQNLIKPLANNEEKFMHLNGAISGVKSLQIICNKNFPEYIKQNNRAYNKWQIKFSQYIEEVKLQYSYWIELQANKENIEASEIKKILDNYLLAGQTQSERNYLKRFDRFKTVCKKYPEHLNSKITNIQLIVEELNRLNL